MHGPIGFSEYFIGSLGNTLPYVLTPSKKNFSRLIGHVHKRNRPNPLVIIRGNDLVGKTGKLGLVGLNPIKRFSKFEIFLDGGNLVIEPAALLLKLLIPTLIGVDPLFKTNQNVR
jgi:hypothetical protein